MITQHRHNIYTALTHSQLMLNAVHLLLGGRSLNGLSDLLPLLRTQLTATCLRVSAGMYSLLLTLRCNSRRDTSSFRTGEEPSGLVPL